MCRPCGKSRLIGGVCVQEGFTWLKELLRAAIYQSGSLSGHGNALVVPMTACTQLDAVDVLYTRPGDCPARSIDLTVHVLTPGQTQEVSVLVASAYLCARKHEACCDGWDRVEVASAIAHYPAAREHPEWHEVLTGSFFDHVALEQVVWTW